MERTKLCRADLDERWVIVKVAMQSFAIPVDRLQEMLVLPAVSHVPNAPGYVRGVINLRGRILPVVDLRKRLDWSSIEEEVSSFCQLMEQREQDHKNWLNELDLSVRDVRQFKLTTDPHKCAFGKWYDSYKTENPWLAGLLRKFDAPHKAIHQVAVEVGTLIAAGRPEDAQSLIQSTRDTVLSAMVQLFSELRALFRKSHVETLAIINSEDDTFGITVDTAISVERLIAGSVEPLPDQTIGCRNNIVQRIGMRIENKEAVLILEPDSIL